MRSQGGQQYSLVCSSGEPKAAEASESLGLLACRNPSLGLPSNIPVTALVVAPSQFYSSRGQKANAVAPAMNLLARFSEEFGVDARLAVWDSLAITDWRPIGVQ
jgi:hypothetical protein